MTSAAKCTTPEVKGYHALELQERANQQERMGCGEEDEGFADALGDEWMDGLTVIGVGGED